MTETRRRGDYVGIVEELRQDGAHIGFAAFLCRSADVEQHTGIIHRWYEDRTGHVESQTSAFADFLRQTQPYATYRLASDVVDSLLDLAAGARIPVSAGEV